MKTKEHDEQATLLCRSGRQHPFRAPQRVQRIAMLYYPDSVRLNT